jgi:hypothetical protein
MKPRHGRPGSRGEHALQKKFGSAARAGAFYERQMLDRLTSEMRAFIDRMEFVFIATADGHGECDGSFRAGLPGFVRVLDEKRLVYPEYRGNGVYGSLGNIAENPHVGLFFDDFVQDTVGLHVNGTARIVENDDLLARPDTPGEIRADVEPAGGRRPERWVLVEIQEAYIHCSKHIPRMAKRDKKIDWGTDDMKKKGGDYFRARACRRPWGGCADGEGADA